MQTHYNLGAYSHSKTPTGLVLFVHGMVRRNVQGRRTSEGKRLRGCPGACQACTAVGGAEVEKNEHGYVTHNWAELGTINLASAMTGLSIMSRVASGRGCEEMWGLGREERAEFIGDHVGTCHVDTNMTDWAYTAFTERFCHISSALFTSHHLISSHLN